MRWMNLETVTLSEVSRKEENKYHTLTHICGIQKNGTDESIRKAGIETQPERTDLWTRGREERLGHAETVALRHMNHHM